VDGRAKSRHGAGQSRTAALYVIAPSSGAVGFTEDDWRQLEAIKPIEPAPTNH
jgi:hypothetical protein